MHNNNNIMSPTTSIPLASLDTSLTPSHHLRPALHSPTPAALHTPHFLSHLNNSSLTSQRPYRYTSLYQPQSQTLSQDEWDLILSFRMMKNPSILPPFLATSSSVYEPVDGIISCQPVPSFHQTDRQVQSSRYHATTATPEALLCHDAASTMVSKHLSCSRQIQCPTVQIQRPVTTDPASLSSSTITSVKPQIGQILQSPRTTLGHQNHSPIPELQPHSPPSLPRSSTTIAVQPEHGQISSFSQIQLDLENHSPLTHLPSRSPSPPSPSLTNISPVQQQQQKTPNENVSAFSRRNQSAYSEGLTTYQYNPTITGPAVELLDSTKPYQIGDHIKVGERTLQSDILSMKYWLEDDITVTETLTGGHILYMAGYSYFTKYYGKNFTTWECTHRRRHNCSSIIIRSSNPTTRNYFRIYSIQGEHIHEPAPDNIEVRKFTQRIRDRCRQELSCPRTIYEDELMKGKFSAKRLAVLPTFYNMKSHLYRIRQEHLPTSPTDPNFELHTGFTSTDKGERFLLYDSNNIQAPYAPSPLEIGRLIIYASDLQLDVLSKSKRVGSDGTFETAAQISQQNYIIMGEFEEKHSVPLVFCLCEHKNYGTYQKIIQILKTAIASLKTDFNPTYWMSDYEDGLTKAIKEELPNTQLLGCAFHYHQAIYRNIQGKGLQDAYQNIEVIRLILRQIMALAFVPSDHVKNVYYDVVKQQLNDVPRKPTSLRHNLHDFFRYYESHWLKRVNQFCVFDQPTRTNNGLEGYNNKMNVQLSTQPHLYRLILWFEKEELLIQQLVTKVVSNIPVYKRKQAAITIRINNSLESLWKNYNDGRLSPKELLLESSKWVARKV